MYSRLFELIRKEEVVLFVGAGFSINAGYPSGEDLCKRIFDDLSGTEKTGLTPFLINIMKILSPIEKRHQYQNFI